MSSKTKNATPTNRVGKNTLKNRAKRARKKANKQKRQADEAAAAKATGSNVVGTNRIANVVTTKSPGSNRIAGNVATTSSSKSNGSPPNRVANVAASTTSIAGQGKANRVARVESGGERRTDLGVKHRAVRDESREQLDDYASELWASDFKKILPAKMPTRLTAKKLLQQVHQKAIAKFNEVLSEVERFDYAILNEYATLNYEGLSEFDEVLYGSQHEDAVIGPLSRKGISSLPSNLRPTVELYASGDVNTVYHTIRNGFWKAVRRLVDDTLSRLDELEEKKVIGTYRKYGNGMIRLNFYRDVEHATLDTTRTAKRRREKQEHQHEVFFAEYHGLRNRSWERVPITPGARLVADWVPRFLLRSASIVEGDMPCSRIIGHTIEETTVPLYEPAVLIGELDTGWVLCGWDERDLKKHGVVIKPPLTARVAIGLVAAAVLAVPAALAYFYLPVVQ